AHIQVRAAFQPVEQPSAVLFHSMLHVYLLLLVARKGHVHAREGAVLSVAQPFELVEEVAREVAVAEDQPVVALVTVLAAMLDKRAIGRDAGAGADHDDGRAAILRQPEAIVALDKHRYLRCAAREEAGGRPPVLPAELLVLNYCYG